MLDIAIVEFDFADTAIEDEMCAAAGLRCARFRGRTPEEIIAAAQGAPAMITSYGAITREVIEALSPSLCIISRTGVGVDNIDIEAATEYGIAVCNVPGYGTEVVSDHAIALALSCLRRIPEQDANLRSGTWSYAATRPLGQCKGRRFGVVGMGAIGTATARKAAGLGFEVVCTSRSLEPGGQTPQGWSILSFDELIETSSVVSFHTALTPETHHMLDEGAIARMRPDAVVVNTSRGAVIDTVALAEALKEGRLWAAGLDVFESEPLEANHPILSAPHTVLTPHAAYWSEESGVELRTRACQAAIDMLSGRYPNDCLNPEVLARKAE